MRRRRRHRKGISIRDGMLGLDAGGREHALDGHQVERKHRAKQRE